MTRIHLNDVQGAIVGDYGTMHVHLGDKRVRRPWMAPPQAAGIVDRPELAAALSETACEDGAGLVAVTGLHGTGGFGKTTLVTALCHEPALRERFPGGLLWVTIGEHVAGADLASRANDLVAQLTGERPAFTDPFQAGAHLGEVLDARTEATLLVVDDVWHESQVEPFVCGGVACRRLITTRNRWVLPEEAAVIRVDRMTETEAISLLTRKVDGIPPDLRAEALARTGRWPVLLALINRALVRSVRYGTPADQAMRGILARLREEGPVALDAADVGRRSRAVDATIRASLDLLSPGTAARFAELAVFAEDTDVPLAVLELLWAATPAEARATCEELADLSLVMRYRAGRGVRLHDVIRAYLVHGTSDLAALHGKLLDAAAATLTAAGEWWTLPERYEYLSAHLAGSMCAGGRGQELAALTRDPRWIAQRIQRHGPESIEADLARAPGEAAAGLERRIRENSHLLINIEPPEALPAVLLSRLAGVVEAAGPQVVPRLENRWQTDDRSHPAVLRTVTGHAGAVTALAVSPDGEWLASGDHGGTVRIIDARTGRVRCLMRGHDGGVRVVVVEPKGRWLAARDGAGIVRLWDPLTGSLRHTLTGTSRLTDRIVIAPDGTWLAAREVSGTVRTWDAETGAPRLTLEGHDAGDGALAITPGGSRIATSGYQHAHGTGVAFWDAASGELQRVFAVSGESTSMGVAISPDESFLVAAFARMADETALRVQVWDLATGDVRYRLTSETDEAPDIVMSPAGDWFALAGPDVELTYLKGDALAGTASMPDFRSIAVADDGSVLAGRGRSASVQIYRPATRALTRLSAADVGVFVKVAVGPGGSWLAIGDTAGTVKFWQTDAAYDEESSVLPANRRLHTLCPAAGGRVVVGIMGDGDAGMVKVWDTVRAQELHWYDMGAVSAFAAGSEPLMVTAAYRAIQLWDLVAGERRFLLEDLPGRVTATALAPDCSWLLAAGQRGWVASWRADGTSRRDYYLKSFARRGHEVRRLVIAPDGTWFAAVADDGLGCLVDVATGEVRRTVQNVIEAKISAAAPGVWLAATGSGGSLTVTDAVTGASLRVRSPGPYFNHSIAVAADSAWLATAQRDAPVRIWDGTSQDPRHVLPPARGLAVSPDSAWLATAAGDTITVWDPVTGAPRAAMRVNAQLETIAWLLDPSVIVAGGDGGQLYGFDVVGA